MRFGKISRLLARGQRVEFEEMYVFNKDIVSLLKCVFHLRNVRN